MRRLSKRHTGWRAMLCAGALGLATLFPSSTVAQTPGFAGSGLGAGDSYSRENPHPLAPQQITQNFAPNTLVGGTSIACQAGGITTDNHWWRLFDLDDDHALVGPMTVASVDYGIETAVGPEQNLTATTYCLDEGLPFLLAFLTQVGTQSQPQPDAELEFFNIAVGGSCDSATQDLAVDLSSDDCLNGALPCNCCAGGDGVGCDCAPCEDEICELDSFCCSIAWDPICDAEAQANCSCCPGQDPGACTDGGGGGGCNCCSGGDGVGCDDPACAETVCETDWFCCEVAWDLLCNAQAESQCDCCSPPPLLGVACVSLFIGANDLGQSAPTYIHADDCGIFDPLDLAAIGFASVHLVMVVNGEADGGGGDGGAGDGGGDGGGDGAGDGGDGGKGGCVQVPGPECNCCSGGNGVGCDCAECEDVVCASDPFCCDTAWDSICDEEAQSLCNCCPGQDPGGCGYVEDCGGGGGVPATDGVGLVLFVITVLLLSASAYFRRQETSGKIR